MARITTAMEITQVVFSVIKILETISSQEDFLETSIIIVIAIMLIQEEACLEIVITIILVGYLGAIIT